MALDCATLATGITGYDCANPLVTGMESSVILINKDDIDKTLSTIANGILTAIVLKSGKIGYLAQSLPNSFEADNSVVVGDYSKTYEQNLTCRFFDNTPTLKSWLEKLDKSKVVAVIKNNYIKYNPTTPEVKGQTVFEVLGWYTGLEVLEGTNNKNDMIHVRKLGCNKTNKEPTLPISFFKTDEATTETAYTALYTHAGA